MVQKLRKTWTCCHLVVQIQSCFYKWTNTWLVYSKNTADERAIPHSHQRRVTKYKENNYSPPAWFCTSILPPRNHTLKCKSTELQTWLNKAYWNLTIDSKRLKEVWDHNFTSFLWSFPLQLTRPVGKPAGFRWTLRQSRPCSLTAPEQHVISHTDGHSDLHWYTIYVGTYTLHLQELSWHPVLNPWALIWSWSTLGTAITERG